MDPYKRDERDSEPQIDYEERLANAPRLDYEGHDIRIFIPGELRSDGGPATFTPPIFGDLDPNKDGPDPEVWPLDLDPGDDDDKLYLEMNDVPAPHVRWVTEDYLEAVYGYNPYKREFYGDELPPYHVPDHIEPWQTFTVEPTTPSMSLTDDRVSAIQRFARLWNGEVVNGSHLLLDKIPSYDTVFGDLDYDDIRRLHMPNIDSELIEAFGDCDWFGLSAPTPFRNTGTWILRKKCYYDPTPAMHTLTANRDEFPTLIGDPMEGIRHRVTAGLVGIYHVPNYATVATYDDVGLYTVDARATDPSNRPCITEVITGHNDTDNKKNTYRKLMELAPGRDIHVAFDTLDTLKETVNYWIDKEGAELTTGKYSTVPNIDTIREQVEKSAADPQIDWFIDEVSTADYLWRQTLGSSDPPSANAVLSLDW